MHPQPNPPVARGLVSPAKAGETVCASGGVDVGAAGRHDTAHRHALGRKRSTLEDYESTLRVHLIPFFSERNH